MTTGQQTNIDDVEIKDADTVQAVKAWFEAEVILNQAKARINLKALEKTHEDAKQKAIEMLPIPGDGNRHSFRVSDDDGWGTVVKISGGGDPTPIPASTRKNNPRIALEGTKAEE